MFTATCVVALLVLINTLSLGSAALSLFHGRLSDGVTIKPVQGIVALGLGGTPVSQFLDCNGTGNLVVNLRWTKDKLDPRVPVKKRSSGIRLDLSTAQVSDEGIYVCRDVFNGDSVSISVSAASLAISPSLDASVVTTMIGSAALLRVYISSVSLNILATDIVWRNPKLHIISSSAKYVLMDSNTALRVTRTSALDSGNYSVVINKHTSGSSFLYASTTITLKILVPPALLSSPMHKSILEHEDVELSCVFSGYPKPVITWMKEGGSLPVQSRTNTRFVEVRGTDIGLITIVSQYIISDALASDEGRYRCSARNTEFPVAVKSEYGQLQVMRRLQLSVTVNSVSTFIPLSNLLSISQHSAVSVTCRGSGVLMWSSARGIAIPLVSTLPTTHNIYQRRNRTNSTQTLIITSFNSHSQSQYICSGNNGQLTKSILLAGTLGIFIPLQVIYTPPAVDVSITAKYVGSGIITWTFNGMIIDTNINSRYTTISIPTIHTLRIHNVSSDVLGTYTVTISNREETDMDSVQLIIPDPPTSKVTPAVLTVNEGENVQFNCTANDTVVAQRWTRDGVVLSTTEHLALPFVTNMSAGSYVCEVFGEYGGSHRSTATLHVNFPPTIEVRESTTMKTSDRILNVTIEHGDPKVIFSCHSEGFPKPTITWFSPGRLPPGVTSRKFDSEIILEWNRTMRYTDSGIYICNTSNKIGFKMATINLLVEELAISISSPVIYTPLGVDVNITAAFVGSGIITWTFNGMIIDITMNSRYTTVSTATSQTLRIHSVSSDVLGTYNVTISISGDTATDSVQLHIQALAISILSPVVYTPLGVDANITAAIVTRGTLITLTITWRLNGMIIDTNINSRYTTVSIPTIHTLHIHNVSSDDLGTYTVTISNGDETDMDSVQLIIPDPPTSIVAPAMFIANEGEDAQFNCLANGTLISLRWTRNRTVLTTTEQLLLSHVTRNSTGSYVCEVFGLYGQIARSTATLLVNFPPTIEVRESTTMKTLTKIFNITIKHGDPKMIFSCHSEGFPKPKISWFSPGRLPNGVSSRRLDSDNILEWNRTMRYTDSGSYTCLTKNIVGYNWTTIHLLVEAAPVVTSITAISPVRATSSTSFSVPRGYSGAILDCVGFAYPPPLIQWTTAGEMPKKVTPVTTTRRTPSVSAKLVLVNFGSNDVGNYSCVVGIQDKSGRSSTHSISLTLLEPLPTSDSAVHCVKNILNFVCLLQTVVVSQTSIL